MRLNNKGFTLVELLGVIVVLAAILLVAIPNISSTLERNKDKIDEKKEKNIISAAEIYFSNNDCSRAMVCKIAISTLLDADLITPDELIYSNGNDEITGYVEYDNNTFTLEETTGVPDCSCN